MEIREEVKQDIINLGALSIEVAKTTDLGVSVVREDKKSKVWSPETC